MALFKPPKTPEEITALTVGKVRKEYNFMADNYSKLLNKKYLLCPKCGEFRICQDYKSEFYRDKRWTLGYFPICKDCLKLMAEQRSSHREKSKECKESVQKVLRLMDRPYIDDWYVQCVNNVRDQNSDAGLFDEHPSAFASYIRGISSLPQFSGFKCWEDSDFGTTESIDGDADSKAKLVKKTIEEGKKRFGLGYSDADYMFLENEYQDWIGRYECSTKAQELVFQSIALTTLQRDKCIRAGKPTKDLDKTIQDWLDTGNLKPKQNSLDPLSDAQTLGTLIQKYEQERPLPEIDPELQDVDKIGKYIEVFFRGHLCKVLGIKNRFSHMYEAEMQRYTVEKPEYEGEDDDSETIFDKLMGGLEDG